jgi:hypothetical protein
MRYLTTLLFAALSLNAVGQVEYPYPYNPDIDNNGFIGNSDLLELLSLYSYEFNAGVLATDSTSAIYYTGNMDYWDCTSSCVGLEGNWKVLDYYLIGTYKPQLAIQSADVYNNAVWIDHQNSPRSYDDNFTYVPYVNTVTWYGEKTTPSNYEVACFCQTRTSFYLPE